MRYTYDLSHCRRRGSNSQMLRKVCSMSGNDRNARRERQKPEEEDECADDHFFLFWVLRRPAARDGSHLGGGEGRLAGPG